MWDFSSEKPWLLLGDLGVEEWAVATGGRLAVVAGTGGGSRVRGCEELGGRTQFVYIPVRLPLLGLGLRVPEAIPQQQTPNWPCAQGSAAPQPTLNAKAILEEDAPHAPNIPARILASGGGGAPSSTHEPTRISLDPTGPGRPTVRSW